MTLYERTKDMAKERGITISKLERDAGLSANSISKWKDHSPRVISVQKVAEKLGVSVSALVGS